MCSLQGHWLELAIGLSGILASVFLALPSMTTTKIRDRAAILQQADPASERKKKLYRNARRALEREVVKRLPQDWTWLRLGATLLGVSFALVVLTAALGLACAE